MTLAPWVLHMVLLFNGSIMDDVILDGTYDERLDCDAQAARQDVVVKQFFLKYPLPSGYHYVLQCHPEGLPLIGADLSPGRYLGGI